MTIVTGSRQPVEIGVQAAELGNGPAADLLPGICRESPHTLDGLPSIFWKLPHTSDGLRSIFWKFPHTMGLGGSPTSKNISIFLTCLSTHHPICVSAMRARIPPAGGTVHPPEYRFAGEMPFDLDTFSGVERYEGPETGTWGFTEARNSI